MGTFELETINTRKRKPIWVEILKCAMQHRVAMIFSFVLLSGVVLSTINPGRYDEYGMGLSTVQKLEANEDEKKGTDPGDDMFQNLASDFSKNDPDVYDDDLFVVDPKRMSKEELLGYRYKEIEAKLKDSISRPDLLRDEDTVYGKAFKFVVETDKRQLKPSDDLLIQRYVLALIYYATNGEEWKYGNLHFLTEVHECHWKKRVKKTWVGVIDCEGMHVTNLELSGQNLNGPVIAEIGLLERLTTLDLGNNFLSSTLPSQLGNLKKLTHLTLASNVISGSIPVELGQLDKAEEILLQFNSFKGAVPESMCALKKDKSLNNFWTDCASSSPPLFCNCCTSCCNGFEACAAP